MPPTIADAAWLRRRYTKDRATVADIATEAGVDPVTVWRALHAYEIPLRGRADARDWTGVLTIKYLEERITKRGMTVYEIAQELDVSPTTVAEHAARHGLVDPTDDADTIRAWYQAGWTIPEIAEQLGVHPRTVRRHMTRAGIEPRPRGRRAAS